MTATQLFPARRTRIHFVSVTTMFAICLLVVSFIDVLSMYDVWGNHLAIIATFPIEWTSIPAVLIFLWFVSEHGERYRFVGKRAVFAGISLGLIAGVLALFIRTSAEPIAALPYYLLAFREELIYRVALPVGFALLLIKCGIPNKQAFMSGIVMSLIVFMSLPGHVAQTTNVFEMWVFFLFGAIMSYFVWETRSLIAAGLLHASLNLLTALLDAGTITPAFRLVTFTILAVSMLMALPTNEERRVEDGDGEPEGDGIIIDLRDHVLAKQRRPAGENAPHEVEAEDPALTLE